MFLKITRFLYILLVGIVWSANAQTPIQEVVPPEHIKTISFVGNGNAVYQFPVVQLGQSIMLSFDDLNADENNYLYEIIHCDYRWRPSELSKNQYLSSYDGFLINEYKNSYNTLQHYTHYQLKIPNKDIKIKISGNYMLLIKNIDDEIIFSRKFVIYENIVRGNINVNRARDLKYYDTHHDINFTISPTSNLINAQKEIKVVLLQNHQWNTAIYDISPQYISGNELVYRYQDKTSLEAGNEYYYFDNKNIKGGDINILYTNKEDLYRHTLRPDIQRTMTNYKNNRDINGGFEIRSLNTNDNVAIEADYAWVDFSLKLTSDLYASDKIYIYGNYNNYNLSQENQMIWHEGRGQYQAKMKLKQGFYNYKYIIQREDGTIKYNFLCGNHWQTENDYTLLIYYKKYGTQYDSLIGIGNGNSDNITY